MRFLSVVVIYDISLLISYLCKIAYGTILAFLFHITVLAFNIVRQLHFDAITNQ